MVPHKQGNAHVIAMVVLAGIATVAATDVFAHVLWSNGGGVFDLILLLLFIPLFCWISIGFWTATFGFVWRMLHPEPARREPQRGDPAAALPKTAIVMPVYNEDPGSVFAGLRAIRESLAETGCAERFDFFILSDSTDPDRWAQEEEAWARMQVAPGGGSPLYYRRRPRNTGRKSGNIRDFCERWGARYRYMVVLDADSLMAGPTLVEMVTRMEADPAMGILQVPPVLANRDSFFARLLQFSSALYGNVFRSGFALWTQSSGLYWGHNAILRMKPFMDCCGLPSLPGRPPWGGEILSHDFVEAALMQRAGWKVVVAPDLGGSYEECPSNLVEFAKRDQRWSRGNLQHLQLAVAGDVRPISRLHFALGAMSYLASPLWALFVLVSLVQGIGLLVTLGRAGSEAPGAYSASAAGLGLLLATLAMLLLVKAWAFLITASSPGLARRFGGAGRLAVSVVLETFVSILIAPILMVFHTRFLLSALRGHEATWQPLPRSEAGLSLAEAFHVHSPQTIIGLSVALAVSWIAPWRLWWLLPVWLGLVLAVPLSLLLSSMPLGRRLRAAGLLVIPEETVPPAVVREKRVHLEREQALSAEAPHPFVRLIADPALVELHADVQPPPEPLDAEQLGWIRRLERIALSGGPTHTSREERRLLLQHLEAVRRLHREAWKDWPLDVLRGVVSATLERAARAETAGAQDEEVGAPAAGR